MLFFTQVNSTFRHRHIVAGQYLGFAGLVLASLPGFFGHFLFPRPWIGLLGLIPIALGLSRLLSQEEEVDSPNIVLEERTFLKGLISPQTWSVAAVTFANGGDNIGIYIPLFASSSWQELLVILAEFFILVGVWCYAAYQLTRLQTIAENLTRYGNLIVPFVLIGLGILILIDSHTLENRFLAVLVLMVSSWCVINFSSKEEIQPILAVVEKRENI